MTPAELAAIRERVAYLGTIDYDERYADEQHLCTLLRYVDELRAAAGRVRCFQCQGTGFISPIWAGYYCPDCTPLRALLLDKL